MVSVVVAAVKELYNKFFGHDEQIAKLKRENALIKQENFEIKARLERVEKMIQSKIALGEGRPICDRDNISWFLFNSINGPLIITFKNILKNELSLSLNSVI